MHTYEMIGVADDNGRTYVSPYGTYNKKDGFKLINKSANELANILLHEDCWRLEKEPKQMTLKEIEEKLGYPIQLIDADRTKECTDFFRTLYNGRW